MRRRSRWCCNCSIASTRWSGGCAEARPRYAFPALLHPPRTCGARSALE
jgi:hypothetical protein